MGLFSSRSSNSSTTNIDETNTNNVDNRGAGTFEGDAVFGGNTSVVVGDGGGDVSIVTTDYGAVKGAIDANIAVSSGAFNFAQESFSESIGFAGDALGLVNDSVSQAFDLTGDAIQQASNDAKFYSEQTAQQFDRSLAFAEQANKSENAKLLEGGLALFKSLGFMALAGVAGYAYLKNKG